MNREQFSVVKCQEEEEIMGGDLMEVEIKKAVLSHRENTYFYGIQSSREVDVVAHKFESAMTTNEEAFLFLLCHFLDRIGSQVINVEHQ